MRDSEIRALIDALRAIEERQSLSLVGLAQQVGCSPGHLSMLFSGKRRPGVRFIRLVLRRYPEIRRLLASSLALDDQDATIRGASPPITAVADDPAATTGSARSH